MIGEVALDLTPIVLVVANALAVRADREQAMQLPHAAERRFELGDTLGEPLLQ